MNDPNPKFSHLPKAEVLTLQSFKDYMESLRIGGHRGVGYASGGVINVKPKIAPDLMSTIEED